MSIFKPILEECRSLKYFKICISHWPDYSDTSCWSVKELLQSLSPWNSRLEGIYLSRAIVDVPTISNLFQILSQLQCVHLSEVRISGDSIQPYTIHEQIISHMTIQREHKFVQRFRDVNINRDVLD